MTELRESLALTGVALTRLFQIAVLLVLVFGVVALCRWGGRSEGGVFPGESWERISPAQAGVDTNGLAAFVEYVGGCGCIVRGGRIVYAWGNYSDRGDVSSAVKPVFAHLVYKAIEEGLIDGLDSPLAEFEPGVVKLNEELSFKDADITWRHLLTQTSCYGVTEEPGTAFNYSDYQTALMIDALVLKVYRTGFDEFDEKVLRPVLTDLLQCRDEPTINHERSLPGRLRISARDFARFGLLYLRGGEWRGKQIVPREDVLRARGTPLPATLPRTRQVPAEMLPGQRSIGSCENQEPHMNSYSYMWWLNRSTDEGHLVLPDAPPDTFLAQGHAGHDALIVVPSRDLVVCWFGFRGKPAWRYHADGHKRVNAALKLLMGAVAGP